MNPAPVALASTAGLALEYQRRGFVPLLYAPGTKGPTEKGWPERRYLPEELAQADGQNVGILTGAESGGLSDVDLDCSEALQLAPSFLPETGMLFGRQSKPHSHRLYMVEPVPRYAVFKDTNGEVLLELRTDGHQTMAPPSHHPCGELVQWDRFEEPARVQGGALETTVRELAAACILVRHWPVQGSRQEAALALAGGLLRAGWEVERVGWLVSQVAGAAGDEEAPKRGDAAKQTARKLQTDEATTGWRSLAAIMGTDVVQRAREWLRATGGDAENTSTDDPAFRRSVEAEAARLRVKDAAARIVRLERAGALPEPSLTSLADFLAVEDEAQRYRVEEIWPVGGRVILAAPYKAGKTTLRDNAVRSLADGELFLGRFQVHPAQGCTVVFDNESYEPTCRRWLRKQNISNTERVMVVSLRGRLSTFDLLDEETRSHWASRLRAVGASIVVFDCLRAALDALGLSEDKDAGRFLVAFDTLLAEAGVPEALVVHHAGHGSERSRGDSRLRDWPDAEWRLVREKADDESEPQPDARRFFSAYGRDVDVPEGLLEYDKQTRRLRFAGGTRKETAADRLIPELLDYLTGEPGATGRQIEKALVPPNRRVQVRQVMRRAIELGQVKTERGERRAILHTVSNTAVRQCAASAPQCAGAVKSECASAPLGAHGALHTQKDTSAPPAHSDTTGHELGEEKEPEFPPEEAEV